MLEYGAEILGKRSAKRIRQRTLAEKINIHAATLVDIENKKIGLDHETYLDILKAIQELPEGAGTGTEVEDAA